MSSLISLMDVFRCSISHELMIDPVIDPCGDTFDRANIEGWLERQGNCPLTRRDIGIGNLIPNRIVRDALAILARNAHLFAGRAEDMGGDDPEQLMIREAVEELLRHRYLCQSQHIPVRIEPPQSFVAQAIGQMQRNYRCC